MAGGFEAIDPERCEHYATFTSHLKRTDFDWMYWTFFFSVIFILFFASWVFQWTLLYRNKPNYDEDKFRKKLRVALGVCVMFFFLAAVLLVIEVHALLALQFCDGEDLMSLYWSTWTMLQLGSEIAILGIVLALWHHLYDIRQPLWALALGTPVLVVAGFGHVISYVLEHFWKRFKAKKKAKSMASKSMASLSNDKGLSSETTSIKPTEEQVEQRLRDEASMIEEGQPFVFEIATGETNRSSIIAKWPSFVGYSANGNAMVKAVLLVPSQVAAEPVMTAGPSRAR